MNMKTLQAVLLMLLGTCVMCPAQAADYFCRVYSGTDTWEKSTVNNGHYKVTAADQAAAEKAALSKAGKLKSGVPLTRARCETTQAGFASVAAAATPSTTTESGGKPFYCMAYSEDGDRLPAPGSAGAAAQDGYYRVNAADNVKADAAALPLAKQHDPRVDSVECEQSPGF